LRYRCHTGHAFFQASLLSSREALPKRACTRRCARSREKKPLPCGALHNTGQSFRQPGREDYEKRAVNLESIAEVLRGLLAGETCKRAAPVPTGTVRAPWDT